MGQSQNVKKRISEHFRLLRNGQHVNGKLQNAFNKYGEQNFHWGLEAICEDPQDLDVLEEAFISGVASFVEKTFYNIANFSKAPMRGKKNTDEIKAKIRVKRRAATFNYQADSYREKLAKITKKRLFSDSKFVAKVKYIVENDSMTYAERGRAVGLDTSSTRKLYLNYNHLKGEL